MLIHDLMFSAGSQLSSQCSISLSLSFLSVFEYTLEVTDGLNITKTSLTIKLTDINDNSPMFEKMSYTFTLQENTPTDPFVYIGTVSASDADDGVNGEVSMIR